MIIWTPMPMEVVMENSEQIENEDIQTPVEVAYQGKTVLVETLDLNKGKIIKLLSTEPNDYLLDEFQPGTVINLS